ncbi:MAG: succinylarginine dihydrolase, partial [Legionella sp. 21-45-4]
MTSGIELNCEGLVGPTHHYGGLAYGNLASMLHAHQPSNPREAALQSLAKMRLLHRLNIPQAVIPPQARPNLSLLEHAGFTGTPSDLIQQTARDAPHLLSAAYSAASMWTANAATVTPSADSANHRVHFTPANCVSGLHRHQEAAFTGQLLKKLFSNPSYFEHHPPLPATEVFADEGAANHNRICAAHNTKGLHLFVYGRSGLQSPTHFPARQTMDASKAVARLHQLNPKDVIFAQQNPKAIDAGVFHHDVIGVANESVLLIHAEALLQQADVIHRLREACPFPLCVIEVPGQTITLSDAIKSFMFNSELITRGPNDMLLVAPTTCHAVPKVAAFLQDLIANPNNPIQEVCFV